jgi:Domain of unknown function (DUF4365)
MLIIGKTDSFEQGYMAKFEQFASHHGVFVKYERDRAARDIGLHLTKDLKSGQKQVTNSLVWFQMKGVMATTLTKEQFEKAKVVKLSLDVEHLRHWFLDKEPTHLVVYVESVDTFLVMNLQDYVTEMWGKDILTLDQKTATIEVPSSSVLDKQAFDILVSFADMAQWAKALGADPADMKLLRRDSNLVNTLGTAEERNVEFGLLYRKWLSKMRDELCVAERPAGFDGDIGDGWKVIHQHWEFGGIDLENSYPYLDLFALEDYEPETITNRWGEEELVEDGETITLRNGDEVFGPNAANEYCEFVIGAVLNEYGKKLFDYVQTLLKLGLLELRDSDEGGTFVSVAPWHSRMV